MNLLILLRDLWNSSRRQESWKSTEIVKVKFEEIAGIFESPQKNAETISQAGFLKVLQRTMMFESLAEILKVMQEILAKCREIWKNRKDLESQARDLDSRARKSRRDVESQVESLERCRPFEGDVERRGRKSRKVKVLKGESLAKCGDASGHTPQVFILAVSSRLQVVN